MSQHSQSFEAEREIAPDKVQQLLPKPVQAAPAPLQAQASRGKVQARSCSRALQPSSSLPPAGTAGITGPSAVSWFRPTTPM